MWAAANDDDARRRRNNRHRRRPPAASASSAVAAADHKDDNHHDNCDYDGDSDSTTVKSPLHDSSSSSSSRRGHSRRIGWSGKNNDNTQRGGKRKRINDENNENEQQGEGSSDGKKRQKKQKRRCTVLREETPEATLSRLQSSYATSMTAMGALHRLSHQLCAILGKKNEGDSEVGEITDNVAPSTTIDLGNDQPSPNEEVGEGEAATYLASLKRVAHAARCAFERSLLLDPVILAPILLSTSTAVTINNSNKKKIVDDHGSSRSRMNVNALKDVGTAPSSAWLDTWKGHHSSRESTGSSSSSSTTTTTTTTWCSQLIMQSTTKWGKFSAAQRRVIRQISYLALVNYADLLLCGCMCHRHCAQSATKLASSTGDVLDRGAVSSLQALHLLPSSLFTTTTPVSDQETMMTDENTVGMDSTSRVFEKRDCHSTKCLWRDDESAQMTVRLALAAYCDASELDPSDPTLWLKLACAARALGRMVDAPASSSSSPSSCEAQATHVVVRPPPRSYRNLERLALERGLSSLPRGVPPNRLIARAWREMEDWDRKGYSANYIEDEMDHSTMKNNMSSGALDDKSPGQAMDQPTELVLHLPKFSWVTLCRILIQASKEGASYGRSSLPCDSCTVRHVWSTNCYFSEDYEFGSPLVDIRLSPLLAVPLRVFRIMCAFMEDVDVKKLACTCTALSSLVTSVTSESSKNDACFMGKTDEYAVDEEGAIDLGADTKAKEPQQSTNNQELNSLPRRGRVSKRVRSQMITTEKHAERKSKRSSVEYCLLAGVLSCTAQNPYFIKMLKTNQPTVSRTLVKGRGSNRSLDADERPPHLALMSATCSPASLNDFILKWSRRNSGPRNLLELLLIHISLNIVDVFEGEMSTSLSSCIIDCFNTIILSSAEGKATGTQWYGAESFSKAGDLDLARTVYAVNLFNAELRFMRCESCDVGSPEQQDDSDYLSFAVPNLLLFASETSEFDSCRQLLELQVRSYWLACSYYLWVGRCTDNSIAKAAEGTALDCLSNSIMLFSENSHCHGLRIKTPHLMSSDRRGDYWHEISAEVLSKYKDHIHSSAIVSRARQYFQDLGEMNDPGSSYDGNGIHVADDAKEMLTTLGSELIDRFNVSSENSTGNLDELISDFRLIHEEDLFPSDVNILSAQSSKTIWKSEVHWGKIWTDIPSTTAVSCVPRKGVRPSIVQVLVASLLTSKEKIPSVMMIHLKMASGALCRFKETHDSLQIRSDQQVEITDDNDCTAFDIRSRRDFVLLRIASFFSDKITDIIASITDETTMNHSFEACTAGGEDISNFLSNSLSCSPTHQIDSGEAILYTHHIKSVSRLVNSIRNSQWLSRQNQERIESVYFVALLKAVIRQKIDFVYLKSSTTDKRTKKWQAQLASKADLMFVLAVEVAELLSLNPSVVCADGTTRISHLVKALQDLDTTEKSYSLLAQFSEALLWFWEFLHDTSSPANILMVPIASAIIALCGSYGVTVEGAIFKVDDGSDRDILSFSDYFDSEDSVNGSFLPGDSSEDGGQRTRRLSLRKMCQLVQCVSIVFQSIDHKVIEQSCPSFPSSRHGPFLPLVMVRVLSNMSRGLFQLFSEDARGEAYPFGAREYGATIDSLLGKAYRYLHGFSFSGDSVSSNTYAPESIEAANSLFHCIKRVYRDSRKVSPPSKAFEVIALALPAAAESNVSIAIKAFLFDADKGSEVDIQSHTMQPTTLPSGFPEWVFDTGSNIVPADEREDNIELLRRGVAYELAKGSMTNLDSTQRPQSNDEENQGLSAEREMTQNHELCLYQKFLAVLNDLCYDPKNIERWVVLSECLGFKADSICDRLVRVQDPFDSSEFGLNSMSKRGPSASLSLDQLKASQFNTFQGSRSNKWKPYLGNNLHVYMQYPWSNLSSLEACAKEIRCCFSQIGDDASDSDFLCWKEIQSKFDNGDYASWANSWGGLFVMALRKMRLKALLVARHLAKNSQEGMHPSEVCEDLGTALYGDLMASTVYGYPIHHMTLHEKRAIAERSNMHFQEAIELSTCNDYSQKCHIKPYESYFMVGKGYEKIGTTLRDEKFVVDSKDTHTARLYETVMNDAIHNYAMAVAEAQKAELSCGRPDKVGGSSHGALECVYRLNACRFKVMLSAVKCAPSECELAEFEAFRIASANWFSETHVASTAAGVREKTWCIFADCVDAFIHCREEVPTFHRAAYRLAQAYNYAPLFYNTNCDLIAGSRQAAPSAKSYEVKGLDTSSCAESANVAISKLFDKRRSQLCSVWVTTSTAPSPFEVINDSIRKYDALRMKYILAFVDCMRVCKRIDSIESFLTWTSSSDQDLPGFYEASASLRGSDPGKHTKQSYLSTRGLMAQVKRIASNALAEIILSDLADMKRIGIDNDARMKLNSHFQLSYRLFQLLNSSCRDVAEFTRSNTRLPVVDAFGKCYLAIQAGYRMSSINLEEIDGETMCSILEGASAKAKTMMQDAKTASSKKDKE